MTTKLQEFLRSGGTIEQLKERYALQIKPHPKYPNLHQFRYDQIESPMQEPLVAEARGIILDEENDWAVVARPFDKFWNMGDFYAAKLDWSTAKITEKLDGSLIILYHYRDEWHVATSGTPDASGEVYGYGTTFAKLFWDVFDKSGMRLTDLDPGDEVLTFMFELTTPFNRIVVPHKQSKVSLIGIRARVTGTEIPPALGPAAWPRPKSQYVSSEEEVVATFATFDAINQEGWVATDENFNRIKVKHPQYIVLHHMRGNGDPSPKMALEVILNGEHEEVLTYWPEWRPLFQEVNGRLEGLEEELRQTYSQIGSISTQKEFALEANKTRCPSALFMVRAGKTPSFREFFVKMNIKHLASILKLDDIRPSIIVDEKINILNAA